MKKPRILGLVGSPRQGRNTATLVQQVLSGAAATGAETRLVYLQECRLEPCQACDACRESGRCVQEDGMRELGEEIDACRGLVIGTPIYFDHVSAQTKLFLDRLYPYVGPDMEHRFPPGRKAVLAATWGASGADEYAAVMDWLADRLGFYFDIETVAVLTAADTESHPVAGRDDLLQRAREAGRQLASALAAPPA